MYRKIVVGYDLHDGGRDALALARLIAQPTGARLVVAGVVRSGALPRGFRGRWREQEAEVLSELERAAAAADADVEAVPSSSPARGLHDLAEEIGADLIVVGSSRHGPVGQVLAGNVGLRVLHGAPCAVAIAPRGYREHAGHGLRRIVMSFDGSPESGLALQGAIGLATASGAALELVAVAETAPRAVLYGPGGAPYQGRHELKVAIEQQLRERLDQAVESIPDGLDVEARLVSGDPAQELAAAGATDRAILILGSRGYGLLRRVWLGSVSSALMRSGPCPVLIHPRGIKQRMPPAEGSPKR